MIYSLGFLVTLAIVASPSAADDTFFESKIRPVLARACVRCHGPRKASGGLRLDSREGLLRGGEQGPVAEGEDPDDSLLMRAIRRNDDEVVAMPPDKPLDGESVADLRRWVAAGMPWPDQGSMIRASRHWAFEPVRIHEPPTAAANPIDAFLQDDRRAKGLTPVAPADKRTLIRRTTYDLLGLPPSPDEVEAFLLDDSPGAFETVVDRLLASPHHGEKWGRAWLDVAHYADTAGETADFPVPDAWRYRNYVIDSINADKPYDQFLREQIAGDILAGELPADAPPGRFAELVTATGYLAIARRFGFDVLKDQYLTIDDTIDTVGKGMLGLTIACARCHDHKYDPITADDYYALFGIFESTRYPSPGCEKDRVPRDNVPLLSPSEQARRVGSLRSAIAEAEKALAIAEKPDVEVASRGVKTLASGDIPNGGEQAFSKGTGADALFDLEIHKGEMILLTVSPKSGHGADSTLVELKIAESGGEGRTWEATKDFLNDASQSKETFWHAWDAASTPRLLTDLVKDAEGTPGLLSRKGLEFTPCLFVNTNDRAIAFQTVRQPSKSLALHPGPRGPVVLAWESPIDVTVSITGRVADIDPSGGDGVGWSISIGSGLGKALAGAAEATVALNRAKRELEAFEASMPRGYSVVEGGPHNAVVRIKGDPETLGPQVPRRFLQVLGGKPIANSSASGRRDLADWIADPKNPLTSRVIVNRVWQGHFGNGLVRTPDNFGVRGEPPDHPELLDWLAARLLSDGWSLKKLHRLIVLSEAYRMAVAEDERNARIDPDNLALWRFERRRLTAEEIRDALLAVSGDLDSTPGGPHPFPESKSWSYTQHNPFTAVYDHDRRSVYLMTQRIKRHPFLALFDGPDPNSCTGRRDSTTVPTQALFFLNDPFVHARAASLARRLAALRDDPARLDRATRLLFGRSPREAEAALLRRFMESSEAESGGKPVEVRHQAAWAGWLRVLFSTNEFCYVD
jgi:cytochrome c553